MAFDSQTRNKLQRMVAACRRLLTEEFDDQLQGIYGIYANDGRMLDLDRLTHLDDDHYEIARLLRDRIEHLRSGLATDKNALPEAIRRVLREQAFTVLNRFAALRMAEERGIVQECVAQGLKSKGFQVFESVARSGLGGAYERYRVFIDCLFDELSLDLGVLFDRFSPFGLLFPREQALLKLFDLINDPELKTLWSQDETIGWIYQYFNGNDVKEMRDAANGGAPRNSRELAVRNQFFTPRYVVEFLTDNTVGRIWYEMNQGQTRLKEQCRYLVRRPSEIFLNPGEPAAEQTKQDNLSQEDLLKQPVHISHRPLKDPREIRLLDPACGSMHFGLYAFDLFEAIYDEAWDIAKSGTVGAGADKSFADFCAWLAEFPSKDAFLRQVPCLIIKHNLHGIDIDPRCAQIAGLSLWLRAQKSWQKLGLKPAERPAIKRSNIVCAEPMPGERELLGEFVDREFPLEERPVFARLLEAMFDKMQLAGEAGSLLKIEEEIRSSIAEAKKLWKEGPKLEQAGLFGDAAPKPQQNEMRLDLSGITDEQFWEHVEERIYAALRDYAEQAENGGGFQRRLFAEDAAQGFAFIDVCRKRYEVVVMNPPFGECSPASKTYLGKTYKDNAVELYCAFVERNLAALNPRGFIGCITSSSFVLYTDFSDFRDLLLTRCCLEQLANLGDSVLDGAYVYTASYIIQKSPPPPVILFYDLRNEVAKHDALLLLARSLHGRALRLLPPTHFSDLPSQPLCHWASDTLFAVARNSAKMESYLEDAGVGAAPQADFFSLWWEVPTDRIGWGRRWVSVANGGSFSPFFRNDFLVADWENNGARAIADLNRRYPYLNGNVGIRIQRTHLYGKVGLTYGKRTDRFNVQVLREGSMFTFEGIGVFPRSNEHGRLLGLLGFLNSRFVAYFLNLTAGLHKNDVYLRRLPFPVDEQQLNRISLATSELIALSMRALSVEEFNHQFCGAIFFPFNHPSLARLASAFKATDRDAETRYFELQSEIESVVSAAAGLDEQLSSEIADDQGVNVYLFPRGRFGAAQSLQVPVSVDKGRPGFCRSDLETSTDLYRACVAHRAHPLDVSKALNAIGFIEPQTLAWFGAGFLSYAFGCCFGRWDIRYATGAKSAPKLPDPFAPLPACPPGQLQNAQGLPARSDDVPASYPLKEIPWNGILVDDENHQLDIERRVREVIEIIWKERAEAIEHEACEILGVKTLRDYFRKPGGFLADHLSRYSKSRRQAPIYWPLSTASGSYTLWIYYHRLTDQTLFQAVNEFVKPKLEEVTRDLERLQSNLRDAGTAKERERLQDLQDLQSELKDFHDELLRVAHLPYRPNLNDGVLITASPLWKLFRLPKWQKDLKATWQELEHGDYDWAHLALTLWPDRVKDACKRDRSIAIAHGLESLCEVKAPEKKAKRGKKAKAGAENLELDTGAE